MARLAMMLSVLGRLLAGVALVAAQFEDVASAPFALMVLSADNSTINGTVLAACHEGAAIEGLCPTYLPLSAFTSNSTNSTFSTFTFNTTSSSSPSTTPAPPPSGEVIYNLRGANFNAPSPMSLTYNPLSNVAIPLFEPGDTGDQFVFLECGSLVIRGYINDTTSPITTNDPIERNNWYLCDTYYGYRYVTLAWAVGLGQTEPQNPSCIKVDVKRVFV